MSRVFCNHMGWWELSLVRHFQFSSKFKLIDLSGWCDFMPKIIDKYTPRLFHGVKEELVSLVQLPSLKQSQARALFEAGK